VASSVEDRRQAANWVKNEILGAANEAHAELATWGVRPEMVAALLRMVEQKTISGKAAKDVFEAMLAQPEEPETIVERLGLRQLTDRAAILEMARAVVKDHPDQVGKYRGGKPQLFGFFVGAVLKASAGRANPEIVNEVVREILDE
ncbi:MAG TPA: Asp-tRNA(Asn)/Glu-tRNA(Gln) amidotransferase GatCAB subunit B, partial [Thermoanaerobaculia bacterium]|nr:Asp-tRNA(Asn)/Glu-tRNA(Gln) amidotransferase GatCAB subunit B [Thermoanaerobaculia bacterium]